MLIGGYFVSIPHTFNAINQLSLLRILVINDQQRLSAFCVQVHLLFLCCTASVLKGNFHSTMFNNNSWDFYMLFVFCCIYKAKRRNLRYFWSICSCLKSYKSMLPNLPNILVLFVAVISNCTVKTCHGQGFQDQKQVIYSPENN